MNKPNVLQPLNFLKSFPFVDAPNFVACPLYYIWLIFLLAVLLVVSLIVLVLSQPFTGSPLNIYKGWNYFHDLDMKPLLWFFYFIWIKKTLSCWSLNSCSYSISCFTNCFYCFVLAFSDLSLKLVSAIFYQIFIFSPNDNPSKTMKNVFYFI